jgi:predicted acyl esterase
MAADLDEQKTREKLGARAQQAAQLLTHLERAKGATLYESVTRTQQGVKMSKFLGLIQAVLMISVSSVAAGQAAPGAPAKPAPAPLYTYREAMVPMRDGVHLQTVIMVPLDARGPLPILLRRTPYGVPDKAYTQVPESLTALAADGYILVVQNLRGRQYVAHL